MGCGDVDDTERRRVSFSMKLELGHGMGGGPVRSAVGETGKESSTGSNDRRSAPIKGPLRISE